MEQIESDELICSFFHFKHFKNVEIKDAKCIATVSKYNLAVFGTTTGLVLVKDIMGAHKEFIVELGSEIRHISIFPDEEELICAGNQQIFKVGIVSRQITWKTTVNGMIKDVRTNPGHLKNTCAVLTESQVLLFENDQSKVIVADGEPSSSKLPSTSLLE
jgi:hypothetical protein